MNPQLLGAIMAIALGAVIATGYQYLGSGQTATAAAKSRQNTMLTTMVQLRDGITQYDMEQGEYPADLDALNTAHIISAVPKADEDILKDKSGSADYTLVTDAGKANKPVALKVDGVSDAVCNSINGLPVDDTLDKTDEDGYKNLSADDIDTYIGKPNINSWSCALIDDKATAIYKL
ncbi:hypothetical protein V6259_12575 [Marinomonas sp. TI.3.20]|uniref:hypothetical protein n=1 Tax=Marinomonas sp. TI.3.20 TaxID=3121296 RepID=UPI0031203031